MSRGSANTVGPSGSAFANERRRFGLRGQMTRCPHLGVPPVRGLRAGRRNSVRSPCPVSYTHLTLPTICSV
eukprot:5935106-Alexandrium_andersonii.AAC.1